MIFKYILKTIGLFDFIVLDYIEISFKIIIFIWNLILLNYYFQKNIMLKDYYEIYKQNKYSTDF